MAGLIEKDKFETAYNLHQRILITAQMAQKNLYDMCVMLKEMRDDKLYKELGYQNFEDYCENEVGFNRSQAHKYISIIENVSENVYSSKHFGVTKLYLLSTLSEPEQEKIQQTVNVEDVSVRELKAEIARLKDEKQAAAKAVADANKRRIAAESDLLSAKSKNRSLSHDLAEAQQKIKNLPDTRAQDTLIKDLGAKLSQAEQDNYNNLEAQRIEYQNKINALQEQLNHASSVREVAIETVEVPAVKEIFEAYSGTVRGAFKQLTAFIGGLDKTIRQDYVKETANLLDQLDDDLYNAT